MQNQFSCHSCARSQVHRQTQTPKATLMKCIPTVTSPDPLLSRRALLAGVAAVTAGSSFLTPAEAVGLHSATSAKPAVLTFQNSLGRTVKIYWLNYDGDAEFYALVPPGGWCSVDTFETHPWRVVDASTGLTLREYVARGGDQLLRLDPLLPRVSNASSSSSSSLNTGGSMNSSSLGAEVDGRVQGGGGSPSRPSSPPAALSPAGFDGVGGGEEEYVECELAEVAVDPSGGVALLMAQGYSDPIPVHVAAVDAAHIFQAAGAEFRRPTTVATWAHTLQAAGARVERVLITREVGPTLYSRILLLLPDGAQSSLDSRPSDSLALALRTDAPLFISRRVAREHQKDSLEHTLGDLVPRQLPPALKMESRPPAIAKATYDHIRSL